MDYTYVLTALLSGGVGLWIIQTAVSAIRQSMRAKGKIRSEKDALVIARSQWIERYTSLRNSFVRNDAVPPLEVGDAYDEWLEDNRNPINN